MDRRDFLSTSAAAGALAGLPGIAAAQARPAGVLVVANEFGPNARDIRTGGANRPADGVAWRGEL